MFQQKNRIQTGETEEPGDMELSSGQKSTLVFVGAFLAAGIVLSTIIFPFWNLIREDVFEEVEILVNDEGTCYVDTIDDIPKTISDCTFDVGEQVTIKFGRGLAWATIVSPIISGEIPARILKETKHSVSFLDAFPLARGHTLVIPRNHHLKIQELSTDENADLFGLVHLMIPRVDSLTGATLVAIHDGPGAGQEVPHVHVHLVPRSTNDSAGTVHTMFGSTLKLSESETDEIFKKLRD